MRSFHPQTDFQFAQAKQKSRINKYYQLLNEISSSPSCLPRSPHLYLANKHVPSIPAKGLFKIYPLNLPTPQPLARPACHTRLLHCLEHRSPPLFPTHLNARNTGILYVISQHFLTYTLTHPADTHKTNSTSSLPRGRPSPRTSHSSPHNAIPIPR